jgi:hypothetical protein
LVHAEANAGALLRFVAFVERLVAQRSYADAYDALAWTRTTEGPDSPFAALNAAVDFALDYEEARLADDGPGVVAAVDGLLRIATVMVSEVMVADSLRFAMHSAAGRTEEAMRLAMCVSLTSSML